MYSFQSSTCIKQLAKSWLISPEFIHVICSLIAIVTVCSIFGAEMKVIRQLILRHRLLFFLSDTITPSQRAGLTFPQDHLYRHTPILPLLVNVFQPTYRMPLHHSRTHEVQGGPAWQIFKIQQRYSSQNQWVNWLIFKCFLCPLPF